MGAAMPQARPIPGQAPVPMQGLAAGNMPKVAEFQKCFWNSIGDRHSSGSRFSPDFLANSAALRGAAAGGASPWSKGAMLPGANPAAPPPGSQLAPDLLPFGSGVGAPAVPMQMTPPGGAGAPPAGVSPPPQAPPGPSAGGVPPPVPGQSAAPPGAQYRGVVRSLLNHFFAGSGIEIALASRGTSNTARIRALFLSLRFLDTRCRHMAGS